jgi:thiol:disulfide interchange protein DsbA
MHGRALYVGELMKNQEEIHDLVFDEFNANRNVARNNKDMAAILAKAGVPEDKYEAIATSFLVDQKIGYASKLTRAAQVNSTPSVVIDGKYKVSGYAPGITVEILEELIERAIQD